MSSTKNIFGNIGIAVASDCDEALSEFFFGLPSTIQSPIFVLQTTPSDSDTIFSNLYATRKDVKILLVEKDFTIEKNCIYLCPYGRFFDFDKNSNILKVTDQVKNETDHFVDYFFSKFGKTYSQNAIAIILSGKDLDGVYGIQELQALGGTVFVQEPKTASLDALPQAIINAGCTDFVLKPKEIAEKLSTFTTSIEKQQRDSSLESSVELATCVDLLYSKTGQYFHSYKQSVLIRRIRQRMQFHALSLFEDYLNLLRESKSEANQLAFNLMIGYTSFFRNPECWKILKDRVIWNLVNEKSLNPIRIWIPACASGEEAYTVAMIVQDEIDKAASSRDFQIFATDINNNSLNKARSSTYVKTAYDKIDSKYKNKYFVQIQNAESMVIVKDLREKIVFTHHNVLLDPPFSKLDLIVCRNLLIYLQSESQNRCLEIFHYALNDGGYLFQGRSESIETHETLFQPIDIKALHIFKKTGEKLPSNLPVKHRPKSSLSRSE